jgi:hypothetical protein
LLNSPLKKNAMEGGIKMVRIVVVGVSIGIVEEE